MLRTDFARFVDQITMIHRCAIVQRAIAMRVLLVCLWIANAAYVAVRLTRSVHLAPLECDARNAPG